MALKFRRGSTAQQSGSLAFGEPYVNTTLGTLIVGGASGDIVLAAGGTGSTGNFGPISGSGLDITGNANIGGNLTLGGNITIGDANTDNLVINADLSSSLIPNNDNAFTIGTAALRYSNIYGVNIIGAIQATNGVVSGSSQITYASISSIPAGIVSGAAQVTPLLPTGTVSGSSQVTYASISSIPSGIVSGAAQVTPLLPTDVVSGSAQVTLGSTTGFSTYDAAISTITGSLISTASANTISITNINSVTASSLTRFTNLETTSASVNTSVSNLNTFSGSQLTQNSVLATYTGSINTQLSTLASYTSSLETKNSSLATITGSLITTASLTVGRLNAIEAVSGTFARTNSANIFTGNQTITGSLYVTQDLIVAGSSSIQTISSSNVVIGASYVTLNSFNPASRFAGLKIYDSGSTAATASIVWDSLNNKVLYQHPSGADTYNSAWLISGPANTGALGSETGLTINKIQKATDDDHIGDSQITDDGTVVSIAGALSVTGSVTASAFLGTIRATNGVVSGSSQIVGSAISTNTITIGTTSFVLGGSSTTLSGLASVAASSFTGALTGNASTATTLATARTINGTSFDGSANITIPNLVSGSSQISAGSTTGFATDVKTQLNANTVISGSSQVVGSSITTNTVILNGTSVALGGTATIPNLVSGSSQITAGSTTNFAADVKTQLNSNTVISGSGQVAIASTSGFGTYINQALLTTSTPTFGNLTINGTITATGDITAYFTSDRRHKNNIQTISNAVLKVKQLNGVTWEWNDDVNEVTKSTPKTGLIAQEVQLVLPQVVTERENGFLALDYSKMVGLLVEAIKEQQIQIDQLKAQIGSK